jgi:hypothetical protein
MNSSDIPQQLPGHVKPQPAFIPLETLTPTCVLANFVPFSFAIILCTNFIATFAHLISHSASFFLVWQPLYHDRKNWETKIPLTLLIGRKTPFPAKAKKGILSLFSTPVKILLDRFNTGSSFLNAIIFGSKTAIYGCFGFRKGRKPSIQSC